MVVPLSASAQTQEATALYRSWLQSQRDAIQSVDLLSMNEAMIMTIDGGFGKQSLEVDAERIVGPGADPPGRLVRRMVMNDREVPVAQGERFRRRMRGLWRPEIGRLLESFRFPVQDFPRMRLAHPIMQEEHALSGGGPSEAMWRVDLVPQELPDPVERLTAWFDADSFRLRESLAVLEAPGQNSVRVETSYVRVDGIDLPSHILADGSSRMLRRSRYFTTLFQVDMRVSDHKVIRGNR